MKIVVIGESVREGWAQTFKRGFEKYGHQVAVVDDRAIYRASSPLARNRYAHRLLWRLLAWSAQGRFMGAVVAERPDFIFMLKGWLWMPRTLRALARHLPRAVISNYNPDSPFNQEAHGNANNWIRRSIPTFDLYMIWSQELKKRIMACGARRSEYLPCGYDPDLHYPVSVTAEETKNFGSDVVFVGSWDKEREGWIRGLLDYDIKVWGNSWEKAAPDVRAAWQGTEVVGDKFAKVCAASKIVLDFLRPQNRNSHNMKTFEIPACKGFMLSERSGEQQGFFREGKEAEYFTGLDELRQKINRYLANPGARIAIAEAGHNRLVNGRNTYADRAMLVLDWCREIQESRRIS